MHLNDAFESVVGKTHHTEGLHVYSNVGRAVMVGDWTTHLLQEVPRLQREEGSVYYEPSQERFRSVRYNGGGQREFEGWVGVCPRPTAQVGRTHTTISLHFRSDIGSNKTWSSATVTRQCAKTMTTCAEVWSRCRWVMLRKVSRSLMAVIGAQSKDVFAMEAVTDGTPLDVFEYLLDELHWETLAAFLVWLDEGYPWPESWQ